MEQRRIENTLSRGSDGSLHSSLTSFHIQKSPNYLYLSSPKPHIHSPFSRFLDDPVYGFPILISSNSTLPEEHSRLILTSADFTLVDAIDIKKSLQTIQDSSPFARGDIIDLDRTQYGKYTENSIGFKESVLSQIESQVSENSFFINRRSIKLNDSAMEEIRRIQQKFIIEKQDLNSMSIRSSVEQSEIDSNRESLSLFSNELIFDPDNEEISEIRWDDNKQKDTVISSNEEAVDSKPTYLQDSPIVELIPESTEFSLLSSMRKSQIEPEIPQELFPFSKKSARVFLDGITASKKILSTIPEFPRTNRENLPYFKSPLYRKLVVCSQADHNSAESTVPVDLLCSIAVIGFSSAPTIRYSEATANCIIQCTKETVLSLLFSSRAIHNVLSSPISLVACGYEHIVALNVHGKAMSWGYGASGVLGHGTTNTHICPTLIQTLQEETVIYAECGGYHNAVLTDRNEVWVWGRNDVHQLGISEGALHKDDFGSVAFVPVTNKELRGAKDLACGEAHTLVVGASGEVLCFGWGEHGQLGLSQNQFMTTRIEKVGLHERIAKVSAGACFSACLTETGELYVWGSGEHGQLGLGKSIQRKEFPAKVFLSEEKVLDLICGENYIICLCESSRVYGWGQGIAGEFQGGVFPADSDIVCYIPREISGVDIVHRFMTREGLIN